MNFSGLDVDERIHIKPLAPPPRKSPAAFLWAAAGALAVLLGLAGWLAYQHFAPIPIDTETEAQIDNTEPCDIKVSRFAADTNVVVIDFPDLLTQGLMLDRVAALIEKAGLPRNRVLGDVELNQAIANCGDTVETYYYGHDYQAADLAKFFALAQAENIPLNTKELWLKRLLGQLGWLTPGSTGALITLPAATPPVNETFRAVILRHELSHGAFYTDAGYRQYATDFWNNLTAADRAAFTRFLGSQNYDTTNTELMLNETQAYLIFTRDPHFFTAGAVGMTDDQLNNLRQSFITAMPQFWLTPMANSALPVSTTPDSCPV
jgi:hypothetical protein